METIGARLERIPHSTGFDYIRFGLAVSVIFFHSFSLTGDMAPLMATPLRRFSQLLLLGMFFALGGFLVTGSFLKARSLSGFLTLRVLRLQPAMIFDVALSALVLGPLVTHIALGDYFASPGFRSYFLNVVGVPQYRLPGVLTDLPIPMVNGQLWTLRWNMLSYAILFLLALTGLIRRRWTVPTLLLLVVAARMVMTKIPATQGLWWAGGPLVVAFFAGCTLYLFRERIPRNGWAAALCLVAADFLINYRLTINLAMLPLAYATVWLGQLNPPRSWAAGRNDYSYGLFLFAFPLQQFVQIEPLFRHWYMNFGAGLALGLLCAVFSWHVIEKPILRRRYGVAQRVEALFGRKKAPGAD